MPDDLRRQLLQSRVESDQRDAPWPGHVWTAAAKAYASGYRHPEIRHPFVLDPTSPISSAEQLKTLLGLETTPQVLTVTVAGLWGHEKAEDDPTALKAQICDISSEEYKKLRELTKLKDEILDQMVWFHGKVRMPIVVESIKEVQQGEGQSGEGSK